MVADIRRYLLMALDVSYLLLCRDRLHQELSQAMDVNRPPFLMLSGPAKFTEVGNS